MESRKAQIATQWIEAEMPKAAEACGFRGWHAFLYACLAEGDPAVVAYRTDHSLTYQSGKGRKVLRPELLLQTEGRRVLVLLNRTKPLETLAEEALSQWCDKHSCDLARVPIKSVEARWVEALNWFRVTRWLDSAVSQHSKEIDAATALLRTVAGVTIERFRNHFATLNDERVEALIACLLHNHIARADMVNAPITWQTRIVAI